MLGPKFYYRLSRMIKGRRAKVLALGAMRALGMRSLVVRMDTTNLCNLRCRMCYLQHEDLARPREEMDLALFDKIAADLLPRTRFLYLGCAHEPLMNPSCAEFLDRIGRYRVPFTSLCTNGVLLREPVLQAAVRSGLTQIVISFNAARAETYSHLRPGAKIETLLENLDLLASLKARSASPGPAAVTSFACMKCNLHELPEFVELCADHKVSEIYVRHLLDFGNDDSELTFQSQATYHDQHDAVAREADAAAKRRGIRLFLPAPSGEFTARKDAPARRKVANPYCLMPWCEFIIKPSGEVRLCSAVPPLGQLRTQSFDEIYKSPTAKQLRRDLLASTPTACSWNCQEEAT